MSGHSSKIVVDLDGVIVGPKTESYDDCKPNIRMVERLRELKGLGYTIAIHTSRNVRTHNHNLGKLTADTATTITRYCEKHNIPCDELWMGKPWVGKVGFYVDDRAISPTTFLNSTVSELLSQVRDEAFGNQNEDHQDWLWVTAKTVDDLTPSLTTSIKMNREAGYRTIIDLDFTVPVGIREELRRAGAKIFSSKAQTVPSYLLEEGLAHPDSALVYLDVEMMPSPVLPGRAVIQASLQFPGEELLFPEQSGVCCVAKVKEYTSATNSVVPLRYVNVEVFVESHIKSRHFNCLEEINGFVHKTALDSSARRKLKLEEQWLNSISAGVNATPIPNGYKTVKVTDSLDNILQRRVLSDEQITTLANLLEVLWTDLDTDETDPATEETISQEHATLLDLKTVQRLVSLQDLIPRLYEKSWIINGVDHGKIRDVANKIFENIRRPTSVHRGTLHGDLCPGNIVLSDISSRARMRVIDPRASNDGKTLAIFGDIRYDLGKLSHALRWGYDTILSGWYDCIYSDDGHISLSLWDEADHLPRPARLKLWDKLKLNIVDDVDLKSDEIQLFAALQLITCAPLHSDDPKRMIALVARGLQAGVETLERMEKT